MRQTHVTQNFPLAEYGSLDVTDECNVIGLCHVMLDEPFPFAISRGFDYSFLRKVSPFFH